MHGNEPAGVEAIHTVIELLEREKKIKPHFEFRGTLLGLIGNLEAFSQKLRFIDKDLNRSWSFDTYQIIKTCRLLNSAPNKSKCFPSSGH